MMSLSRHLGLLSSVGLFALLAGCTVGPTYERPAVAVPVAYKELPPAPPGWKAAAPADDMNRGPWWSVYQDPLLDQLEAGIDIGNQNLKAYEAAHRQALAIVAQARSSLYPTLSASGSDGVGRTLGPNVRNSAVAYGGASWDLDLWGKVRRQVESNSAAAQASAAELAAVRLSAQAELATDYFELRYQDSLEQLLGGTVAAYQRMLDVAHGQYSAGTADASDVVIAETQLESAQAQLIAVGVSRAQYEHAIALLTGRPPSELSIPAGSLAATVPDIPVTLPSALQERRPDVAEEERLMQKQNALIGVALAAYYPDVSLSGLLAHAQTGDLAGLADPLWSLSASAGQLLADGGARRANVVAARATYDQSVATYRQTVLAAFRDVEDALSGLRILAQQSEAQGKAVVSSQRAVEVAQVEYEAQTQTYTTVATAQVTALSAEEVRLQIEESRLATSIALLKALGGGWDAANAPNR